MCGWWGPFQKLTTICSAGPDAAAVLTINEVRCEHASHPLQADGVDAQGRQLSRIAGQYPPLFCAFFGHNFTHATPWHAQCAVADTPVARKLVSMVMSQRSHALLAQLNEQAGAAAAPLDSENDDAVDALEVQLSEVTIESHEQRPLAALEGRWRSAHGAMPASWPEHEDVVGPLYQATRIAPLDYISRRRAEAADPAVLAATPMPTPSVTPVTEPAEDRLPTPWPQGCPPRPIHISQLYNPGVYEQILGDVDAVTHQCQAGRLGQQPARFQGRVYPQHSSQPEWAQQCPWDAADPDDCVPLQPSIHEPPDQGVRPAFFEAWSKRLSWTDKAMIHMVTRSAVEDGSDGCSTATIVNGHHGGLRANFASADASIEADRQHGFVTAGRRDLWIVPSIMVPKNCVRRRMWKLVDGQLMRKIKWRVSTDDSIETEGETSRNNGMDREDWSKPGLPTPRTLAQAVAIAKSVATGMGVVATTQELERVALWAFDLTHAYRELSIQAIQRGRQCFIWCDGVRIDLRCVFGSAHMCDLFQRVTTFVMAVARFRIIEYEKQHPFSAAREEWSRWRREQCGIEEGKGYSVIYIDDGLGLTTLSPGEPLIGSANFAAQPVDARLGVEPGGYVSLDTFANKSRVQIDLAIMRATFQEAGWGIAEDKLQIGFGIEELGMLLSSEGDGALTVPEAKRQGMLVEIDGQQFPPSTKGVVSSEDVDGLVGRCLHIAMAVPEANAQLQPMWAMKEARRTIAKRANGSRIRVKPRALVVVGKSAAQQAYQSSLAWWKHALESGISTPLAPLLEFPELGEHGSAFMFTDAARELGTGHGAFTLIEADDGRLFFIYMDPRWPPDVLQALRQNDLSMPAGEAIGAVVFADALLEALPGVTHLTIFTDSSATAVGIQTSSSPSPQMNVLMDWLMQRNPSTQFMALHQPGKRNGAADSLSRKDSASVLADAKAAGAIPIRLPLEPHAIDLMRVAMTHPQRPRPSRTVQEA